MDGLDMRNTISGRKATGSSSGNSKKGKKTSALLSKENVNVLNTPIWTSPKRSTGTGKISSNNDNDNDDDKPFGSSLGSASKYIEQSLADLDGLIAQRRKELSSMRISSIRLEDHSKSTNNNTKRSKSTEKVTSGSKKVPSTKVDDVLTSPSYTIFSNTTGNAPISYSEYTPMTSSNPLSSNPTPDTANATGIYYHLLSLSLLSSSLVDTSPSDSPLKMVKISRFALNDFHNREKVITQQLKEANGRISYLEVCNSDKDIHIESLSVALTEMQTIRTEMEVDASAKATMYKHEISKLRSLLKQKEDECTRLHTEAATIRSEVDHRSNDDDHASNVRIYELEALLLEHQQQVNDLKEHAVDAEELQKRCTTLEARLLAVSDYDDITKRLADAQSMVIEYKTREKELKDLFDVTVGKVDELKAKGDHYYKLCKDYKKKNKYFENEISSYEKSLSDAEGRAKEAVNKLIEIEMKRSQEETHKGTEVADDNLLLLTKKVKDAEDACLLFKGLYEEAVKENERWVIRSQQLETAAQTLEEEKKVLEGTIFELEVTIAKSEQEFETSKEAMKDLAKVTSALEKTKKKNRELKAGLASLSTAHDSTSTTNSTLLNQIVALQDTIDAKDEQITNLHSNLQKVMAREEEIATAYLQRDRDYEQLQVTADERGNEIEELQSELEGAEERIEALQNELDSVLMEKQTTITSTPTTPHTPTTTTPISSSSPNPFATPFNKHIDSNPNTNDNNHNTNNNDNNNNTNDDDTTNDDPDIDETLSLVNEAEGAFKSGNLYLALDKYKAAGFKGIHYHHFHHHHFHHRLYHHHHRFRKYKARQRHRDEEAAEGAGADMPSKCRGYQ